MRIAFSLVFCLLLAVGPLMADNSVNMVAGWDGSNFISSFGVVNTATYGQTITIVTSSVLNSYAFEIGMCGAQVTFRGEVYAWDGVKATGSALWEGPAQTLPNGGYVLVTFYPGITLPPGQYVIFASTSKDQSGAPSSACRYGALPGNGSYSGGQFVYINNGANPALWTTDAWNNISEDLAFQMVLNGQPLGVPLPSSFPLVVFGLIALGVAGRALMPASRS